MVEGTGQINWERLDALRKAGPVYEAELLASERIIAKGNGCTVIYGPFDAPPSAVARIMLIGLTPGYGQLKLANEVLADATSQGITDEATIAAMRRERAAFAGSMRTNMIAMFDELGLPEYLGLATTAELFSSHSDLVFTTSTLRYPVFVGENMTNYSGAGRMMERPLFQEMVDTLLAPDVNAMPDTLLIPLGVAAESALLWLAYRDMLDGHRVVRAFPHPSGANGHRARIFERNATDLRAQLEAWFSDG